MDYQAEDRAALLAANRRLGVGMWYPYWVARGRCRIELCAWDGWHYRRANGDLVADELLYITRDAARNAMNQAKAARAHLTA